MPKVDTIALRRFLDPVNQAKEERSKAVEAMADVMSLSTSKRAKLLRTMGKADDAYAEAVGELIGGLNHLVGQAEEEAEAP
ncbi:hypothetical protein [Pseudomonas monteilii]|uniref:hypothetical protein n=1 Tax=Pseudomonas monteilii TaxID=76759 RepID=UPI003F6DDE1D